MKKRYLKKINILRCYFFNDNFQEIISSKIFFKFLDYMSEKEIIDFCKVYKKRAKKGEYIKEAILRTRFIDSINMWDIGQATEDLFTFKKQLVLGQKNN